ncbi:unnamed protein product [Cylindrotheca closterium]|uniref:Uncharacterized protein n=1 Tax=Cylindrotheca closterium TaxID=2856 RepID=A0AAD2GBI7_9STRA|nr:unnamed protein product [Cylindrotheca closterium]
MTANSSNRASYFSKDTSNPTKGSLRETMRKASTKFSIAEETADHAPHSPMRQLSHSLRNCFTERSESEMSLSLRFAMSEKDQPIRRPIRQLSKSLRSELSGSTEFNQSLSSSFKLDKKQVL